MSLLCNICGEPIETHGTACAPRQQFTCSWKQRSEELSNYGFILGVLQGLRYQVDDKTRKKIDEALAKVSERKDSHD